MNIDNPTKRDLEFVQAGQQRTWATINAKTQWSLDDFETAFSCFNRWNPDTKTWQVRIADLGKLAWDIRTPKDKAAALNKMLEEWYKKKGGSHA